MKIKNIKDTVYFVSSDKDATVLLAMDIKINDGYISWFDTVKERMMKIKSTKDIDGDSFVFKRDDGNSSEYHFTPITLEIYNNKVGDRLISPRKYDNEEDLVEDLKATKGLAW